MTNTFFIYLLTRLTAISDTFTLAAILSGAVFFISSVLAFANLNEFGDDDSDYLTIKRFAKRFGVVFFISLPLAILTPTTSDAIAIYAGGKTLDWVEQDSSIQQIPGKASELILAKMNEYLEQAEQTRE